DHQLDRPLEATVDGAAAEALQVFGRQVDAAAGQVLGQVAQDVADLQRDAELVGQRLRGGAIGALEDAEAEPAGRARDATAADLVRRGGRGRAHASAPSVRRARRTRPARGGPTSTSKRAAAIASRAARPPPT